LVGKKLNLKKNEKNIKRSIHEYTTKNNRTVFEEGYIETGYIKSSRLIIGE
jgi:hypothetical protein